MLINYFLYNSQTINFHYKNISPDNKNIYPEIPLNALSHQGNNFPIQNI